MCPAPVINTEISKKKHKFGYHDDKEPGWRRRWGQILKGQWGGGRGKGRGGQFHRWRNQSNSTSQFKFGNNGMGWQAGGMNNWGHKSGTSGRFDMNSGGGRGGKGGRRGGGKGGRRGRKHDGGRGGRRRDRKGRGRDWGGKGVTYVHILNYLIYHCLISFGVGYL